MTANPTNLQRLWTKLCRVYSTVPYRTVQQPYRESLPRTNETTFPIRVGWQIAGRLICSWGPCRITRRIFFFGGLTSPSEICPYRARQSQKAAANRYSKIQTSFSRLDQVTRRPFRDRQQSCHNRHDVQEDQRLLFPAHCVTVRRRSSAVLDSGPHHPV